MTYPERLFDCLAYQLERFPKQVMFAGKENGKWKTYSTQEVQTIVNKFSAGLLQLGVNGYDGSAEKADKISIISNNRPEWMFTDLAVQQTGAILVPLYPTTSVQEIQFILNDASVQYMFVNNEEMFEKIRVIQHEIPSLKKIFTFEQVPGASHWSEVMELSNETLLKQLEEIKQSIQKDRIATFIYTSGTTGVPKGVMLSHDNIVCNALYSKESFPFDDAPEQNVLSFLPLNHIFERCITYIYLFSGRSIYYAESMDTIISNLQELHCDGFVTVPRLLEKMYEKIMEAGSRLTGIKRKLFFWAISLAEQYDNNISKGFWYNSQLSLANKLVFTKWRELLGNNIKFIVSGGAACPEKLLRIFNAARIPVYEGYGPTEHSPVIAVNRRTPGDCIYGTVGLPINHVEVKLADDGEICAKSRCVMKGYYKRPDLTAEVIIDGWLHTGDIGVWVKERFLKITDRKKELFKTSGGKYVAPQPIENKLRESPYVEQILVVGPERKFVSALIVPAFPALQRWAEEHKIVFQTNEELIQKPEVKELYQKIINQYNVYFNHVEQIKKFALLPNEWNIEAGEMTPKLSMRRKIIMEKYKDVIDGIYAL